MRAQRGLAITVTEIKRFTARSATIALAAEAPNMRVQVSRNILLTPHPHLVHLESVGGHMGVLDPRPLNGMLPRALRLR